MGSEKEPSDFFFQAEDGIRDYKVTGVQTCALPIYPVARPQGIERDLFDGPVGTEAMCLGREEPDELFQGARGAEHGAHLDPVPEQHDVDERRRLPKEHAPGKAEDY